MKIPAFATEHFYAQYEFTTPHQLCNSDCETISVGDLLNMADMSLAQFGGLELGYTETQGHPLLREMLAASYETEPDHVVMLGTPVEGIYLAARALLEPGDEVVVLTPAYDALINMFEHVVGATHVRKWTFTPTELGWQLDYAKLEELVTDKTKLIVVNFPHNPTGYLPSRIQQRALINFVEKRDLWLFYDEMYFGLVHPGTESIPSAATLSERTIVLSGLSKTYGLPGLRSGWLIIHDDELRANLINWKFYTSICPPAPTEFLAIAAWRVHEQLRQRSLTQIALNLELAHPFFTRWPDLFTWRPPMAGSTALVGVSVPSVSAVAEKLAADAGVLLHPATTLGYDDQHMRLGLGRRAFGTALAAFEAYLDRNGGL